MHNHEPVMDKVHELLAQHHKENPDTSLVLFAVEFLPDGFPLSRSCKITGSPAVSIAGLKLIETMIKESYDDIDKKIAEAGSRTSHMEKLMKMLNDVDFADSKIMKLLNDTAENPDTPDEIKKIISNLKRKFGK